MSIRSFFRSDQPSMTEGAIGRGLISFAVPIFLGNLFQQLYNTADTLIVGNFIGKEALAAVSSSGNLIFMLVGLLSGAAMGAGVIIAKLYGAKDWKTLRLAIHTDLAFGLIGGLFLTVAGVLLTPYILRWMGTPENVLLNSIAYFRTYFFGVMAVFLYNVSAGILQAVGDSRHPLYYLMTASVVNIALDLLFVGVFHWGVAAAAGATVISQAVAAALCLTRLFCSDTIYRANIREIRINGPLMSQILRYGLPSGIQNSVIGLANVIVQSNINAFGANAMAGCGSYAKIEGFAFLPVTCFAMGLATFVGQNLGAKQYDRAKKGARFGILCSMGLAELIGVLIWIFSPFFIALFNGDPEVVAVGTREARVMSLFYFLLAFSHCIAGILRGAGKASVPMLVMAGCWCVIRVLYITLAVQIWPNILIVFFAYPLTWSLSSIIFLIYYLKADWAYSFERQAKKNRGSD